MEFSCGPDYKLGQALGRIPPRPGTRGQGRVKIEENRRRHPSQDSGLLILFCGTARFYESRGNGADPGPRQRNG